MRGVVRVRTVSKVPAHASRLVKKGLGRPNNFFTVAAMEECSNWDVGVGPFGSCNTAQTSYQEAAKYYKCTRPGTIRFVFHVLDHVLIRWQCA